MVPDLFVLHCKIPAPNAGNWLNDIVFTNETPTNTGNLFNSGVIEVRHIGNQVGGVINNSGMFTLGGVASNTPSDANAGSIINSGTFINLRAVSSTPARSLTN